MLRPESDMAVPNAMQWLVPELMYRSTLIPTAKPMSRADVGCPIVMPMLMFMLAIVCKFMPMPATNGKGSSIMPRGPSLPIKCFERLFCHELYLAYLSLAHLVNMQHDNSVSQTALQDFQVQLDSVSQNSSRLSEHNTPVHRLHCDPLLLFESSQQLQAPAACSESH